MGKAKFNSIVFYYFLIIVLFILLIYNFYLIYENYNIVKLLPILIQISLLILVFMKHIKVKLAIKIWSIVILIISSLMRLVGKFLKDISSDFQFFEVNNYIMPFLILLIGCFIFYFNERTVVVEKV